MSRNYYQATLIGCNLINTTGTTKPLVAYVLKLLSASTCYRPVAILISCNCLVIFVTPPISLYITLSNNFTSRMPFVKKPILPPAPYVTYVMSIPAAAALAIKGEPAAEVQSYPFIFSKFLKIYFKSMARSRKFIQNISC
jgi:hypothetical protein